MKHERLGSTLLMLFVATACPFPPTPDPVLHNPPECDSLVAAYRAAPPSPQVGGPRPRTVILPPRAPSHLFGVRITARYLVTERGRVDPASIVISGSTDRAFNAELRRRLASYSYTPAMSGQCWIPAYTYVVFTISQL
jgi:hypothetical protein